MQSLYRYTSAPAEAANARARASRDRIASACARSHRSEGRKPAVESLCCLSTAKARCQLDNDGRAVSQEPAGHPLPPGPGPPNTSLVRPRASPQRQAGHIPLSPAGRNASRDPAPDCRVRSGSPRIGPASGLSARLVAPHGCPNHGMAWTGEGLRDAEGPLASAKEARCPRVRASVCGFP